MSEPETVDWCVAHSSRWDETGHACERTVFSDPYGSRCVKGRALVEVLDVVPVDDGEKEKE